MFQAREDVCMDEEIMENTSMRAEKIPIDTDKYVEVIHLARAIQPFNVVSSPLAVLQALHAASWQLDPKWQTSSHIYRIINDLHHRQRFTDLRLLYSSKLQLVIITGVEPVSGDAVQPPPTSSKVLVYVVPGNFRSATLSGRMRRTLQEELADFDTALRSLACETRPGWIIAVTDGDDVSYYVEKSVTLTELMDAGGTEGTRDAALSNIFGVNRAINLRSVARKKERLELRKIREDEQLSRRDLKSAQGNPGATAGSKGAEEEPTDLYGANDTPVDEPAGVGVDVSKYDEVLHFISGAPARRDQRLS